MNWLKRRNINEWIFPRTKIFFRESKVELDLCNYATKVYLKNGAVVDTSHFANKVNLASLKSEADKLAIDKLRNVTTGLNSLKCKVGKCL